MANKGGRPRFNVDWETVEKLCALQCTGEEISAFLGCSYDTLEKAVKREQGISFTDYYTQKRTQGKVSLRRRQYQAAMEGNATMLVWLGKNWLEQTDQIKVEQQALDENGNRTNWQVTFVNADMVKGATAKG